MWFLLFYYSLSVLILQPFLFASLYLILLPFAFNLSCQHPTCNGTDVPVLCSSNRLDSIKIVTLRYAQLVPGWMIVFGRVNYLGTEPGTQAYSA